MAKKFTEEREPAMLYERPVLVVDPGVHVAGLNRADVDAAWQLVVTCSDDKTVRCWDAVTGTLRRTIRLPQGDGHLGMVYAVSVSPDGKVIAAGGCLGSQDTPMLQRIVMLDPETGRMIGEISGLPSPVFYLAFSRDGSALVAMLADGEGMRLYNKEKNWEETARDDNYEAGSYYAEFDSVGRFATTSWDGNVRLYDSNGDIIKATFVGGNPVGIGFHPDGQKLVVTFCRQERVLLLETLSLNVENEVGYYEAAFATAAAWSADGAVVILGIYEEASARNLIGIAGPAEDDFRLLPGDGFHPYTDVRTAPEGLYLYATKDGYVTLDGPDGEARWSIKPRTIDWRGQRNMLKVSRDGSVIEFDYYGTPARFDGRDLRVGIAEESGPHLCLASPGRMDERSVPLLRDEQVHSLCDHPDGKRYVLGAAWTLRAVEAQVILWRRTLPGDAWAVNISADGNVVVAACGDGTVRWFRMDDGVELLALFPMADQKNWVAWTPEGIYAATPGARTILRWHINRGWNSAGEAIPVAQIPETRRPEVIPHVIPQLGTPGAIAVAELAKIRNAVQRATCSDIAPGARLQVLTIGISRHRQQDLDLEFADRDARDLAEALEDSQSSLYAEVSVHSLLNEKATRRGILESLSQMEFKMAGGAGADLSVIHFAGHGDLVENAFFLFPHDVDTSSTPSLKATAVSAPDFRNGIASIAKHGRVIVFLDACHSGGGTAPLDQSLQAMLQSPNVTVITSSRAGEQSQERAELENGVFTEALLEALVQADADGDGLIRVSDLSRHLSDRVPVLSQGTQHPEVDIHYERPILVALHPKSVET